MSIHNPLPDLYLVDLDQPLEGFRSFISCWLVRRHGATLLVDPGPRHTIPILLDALSQLGIAKVDAILLTHIHIDHAGGAGLLLERYPMARVVCHPKGVPHLIDPERLWQGSLKVLGEVATAYGSIAPVPEAAIGYGDVLEIGALRVDVLKTPGHAPHHLCFGLDDLLFAGEVAGVHLSVQGQRYLRPSTPPKFVREVSEHSLEKVEALDVAHACFGHYGISDEPRTVFQAARAQLGIWLEVVDSHLRTEEELDAEAIFRELRRTDPNLALFPHLPDDVQKRERNFVGNSIRGMRAHLEESP